MKYEHIPKHKCLNRGPDLPMLLTLHPVYKGLSRMSVPLVGIEAFTSTYLRTLTELLP